MAKKKEANVDTTKNEEIENQKVENEAVKSNTESKKKKVDSKDKQTTEIKKATKTKTKEAVNKKAKTKNMSVDKNNVAKNSKKAIEKKEIKKDSSASKKEKSSEAKKRKEPEKNNVENKKTEKKNKEKMEEAVEEIVVQPREKVVSIQEIKQTMKKKQNLPKEEIEKINKHLFQNILVAICIIIYFIFLNLGQMNIEGEVYVTDLKVFSMCVLLLAIALIEKAYKKDDGEIAVYGIEMIVLSLITVALIYIKLMLSTRYAYIITSISYVFAIYYLIKSIVIYLRKRKKYFVDDMKEMINNKEE